MQNLVNGHPLISYYHCQSTSNSAERKYGKDKDEGRFGRALAVVTTGRSNLHFACFLLEGSDIRGHIRSITIRKLWFPEMASSPDCQDPKFAEFVLLAAFGSSLPPAPQGQGRASSYDVIVFGPLRVQPTLQVALRVAGFKPIFDIVPEKTYAPPTYCGWPSHPPSTKKDVP